MKSYRDLIVWQKSMSWVTIVYSLTSKIPESEKFGLISQIRRSSVAIPSNIAEGSGRNSNNEFVHFLGIANGSTYELITQLMISKRLELVEEVKITPIIHNLVEVSNMNFALQKSLKTNNK